MSRRLTMDATMLAAEVAWMAKLSRGSGVNPMPGYVLVTGVLNALQLRRTDFEQYRESILPAEGLGQFEVAVDAAKLAEVLKSMTGKVTVDVADGKLILTAGKVSARLRYIEPDVVWPQFSPTAEPPATLGASQVARALTSIGNDPTLPMLMSVQFEDGAMVSTDRFRLTRVAYAESGFSALVPGMALRAFASGSMVVTVLLGRCTETGTDLVRVASGRRSITVATADHEFPKWRQLIPSDPTVGVMVRREDLLTAATGGEQVTLTVRDDDTMLVSSGDDEGDTEVTRVLEAQLLQGEDLPYTVSMRSKYLIDCLRSLGCGAVQVKGTTSAKPVVVEDVSGSVLHLVMPIRTAS